MLRGNNYPPARANASDAGLDLRWVPSEESTQLLRIAPGQSVLIPTGCKFGIPHGYMLEIKNKSGIAHKKQLLVGACVVDSGYDGEVFVNLHNVGASAQYLEPGDKVAQGVVVPVIAVRFVPSKSANLYDDYPITISDRGTGALGSTGK